MAKRFWDATFLLNERLYPLFCATEVPASIVKFLQYSNTPVWKMYEYVKSRVIVFVVVIRIYT
jgi:hypothetical protein